MTFQFLGPLGLVIATFSVCWGATVVVESPGRVTRVEVNVDEAGRLSYRVDRVGGGAVVALSPLGVTIDGVDLGNGVELLGSNTTSADERYPWRGVHSEARNAYRGATIEIRHVASDAAYTLEFRAFDQGVGYRYIVPTVRGRNQTVERSIGPEASAWRLPEGCIVWTQSDTNNYEGVYNPAALAEMAPGAPVGFPVTIKYLDGTYAAITEAGVFAHSGMSGRKADATTIQGIFEDDNQPWQHLGEYRSAWRVTLTGPTLNDLVNADVVHNLCPPPEPTFYPNGMRTSWIKPGRSLWNWWSGASVAFDEQKVWVDKAAEMSMDYHLVDAGWENRWPTENQDKWDFLKELCEYARDKGVGVQVWKHYSGLLDARTRRDFFARCAQAGVVSVKIDFMDSESREMIRFYTDTLIDAARFQLMVNFHGANKPTGEPRTYPNEMTREGIRGLEYNKWDTLPRHHYAALPFTRLLAGHGDFTPCTFDPEKLKGTTATLQLATAIAYTSPVMHWADRWDRYFESPALEVVKRIPSVWDETMVLPGSEIGEVAALARRSGGDWFIGVINGGPARDYAIRLSFLDADAYWLTTVRDVADKPAEMRVEQSEATARQTLQAKLSGGGGFVAMLTKK